MKGRPQMTRSASCEFLGKLGGSAPLIKRTASTFDSYLRAVSSGDSGNGALRRIKLRHRKDDAA
jgi:hypothetical protein